jgi:hypothetical protein
MLTRNYPDFHFWELPPMEVREALGATVTGAWQQDCSTALLS